MVELTKLPKRQNRHLKSLRVFNGYGDHQTFSVLSHFPNLRSLTLARVPSDFSFFQYVPLLDAFSVAGDAAYLTAKHSQPFACLKHLTRVCFSGHWIPDPFLTGLIEVLPSTVRYIQFDNITERHIDVLGQRLPYLQELSCAMVCLLSMWQTVAKVCRNY